jgi:hypothetical protein
MEKGRPCAVKMPGQAADLGRGGMERQDRGKVGHWRARGQGMLRILYAGDAGKIMAAARRVARARDVRIWRARPRRPRLYDLRRAAQAARASPGRIRAQSQ